MEARYPTLHVFEKDNLVFVGGSFPVMFEGQALDRYVVEIKLAPNHPKGLPTVRETGGRIPINEDRHISPDGTACVLIPDERWRLWPLGQPLMDYLSGPLHSFFLSQTLVEEGEPWPFGQWPHGPDGIYAFYQELLSTSDTRVILGYLKVLGSDDPKGHWLCPCLSRNRIRECHADQIASLRKQIEPATARASFQALGAAVLNAMRQSKRKIA